MTERRPQLLPTTVPDEIILRQFRNSFKFSEWPQVSTVERLIWRSLRTLFLLKKVYILYEWNRLFLMRWRLDLPFSKGDRTSVPITGIALAFSLEFERVDLLLHQTSWLIEMLGYTVSVITNRRIAWKKFGRLLLS